jgi:hypothetical protein
MSTKQLEKDRQTSCKSWMTVLDFFPNGRFADESAEDEETSEHVKHPKKAEYELTKKQTF